MARRVVLMSQRVMKWCADNGHRCGKVEMSITQGRRPFRRDLFGWMDVLAFIDGEWVGIQACASSGRSSHMKKYREDPEVQAAVADWLSVARHRAELWAWRRVKLKRGGKAYRWTFTQHDLREILS